MELTDGLVVELAQTFLFHIFNKRHERGTHILAVTLYENAVSIVKNTR